MRRGAGRSTRRISARARKKASRRLKPPNNTVASTALIPLLSFGIPGSNSAAVLLGGLLIHGLLPGPRLFEQNADVIHGLYAGSFVADIAQVVIGHVDPAGLHLAGEPAAALPCGFHLCADPFRRVHGAHVAVRCRHRADGRTARLFHALFRLSRSCPRCWASCWAALIESNYRRSLVLSGGDIRIFLRGSDRGGFLRSRRR